MLVDSTSEFKVLVPVIIACIDRLLGCEKHHWLGEHLLKILDKHLLPKLKNDYSLGCYFPIFERTANEKVSPSGLLNLLMRFMIFLVEKHGPNTGLKSWHHGCKILGICRTMLIHRRSSSLLTGLSHLLSLTSLYFPDLEVRENARFYLRLLICVPGKKVKDILKMENNLPGISPSSHSGTFFSFQPPLVLSDLRRCSSVSSNIYVERVVPLLVKQSWSLSLPNFGINPDKPGFSQGIRENEPAASEERDSGDNTSESEMLHHQKVPLGVMDAKDSEIVRELRRYFSTIPDYRHMPGIKIKIPCSLRFNSEAFNGIMEDNAAATNNVLDGVKKLPALYASVLTFTSSALYGHISPFYVPFLVGSPPKNVSQSDYSFAVVPMENGHVEEDNLKAPPVCIELEPQEPMPGLVDVFIETNADSGQIIQGQLHSISVGIEDMFLRANLPDAIAEDAVPGYNVDLFNALWEACETSSSTGRETFVLKGGKGVAAISGTQSVKLVEVPVTSLVQAVACHLAPFVVCVIGQPLVDMVKAGGVIKDILWKDFSSDSSFNVTCSPTNSVGPLYLNYFGDEEDGQIPTRRKNIGCFQILIFLPPRFHLLFQMELRDLSTLVRIRTDHWPCLAYVDDYLEALFLD
ncbi:hypothetical protein OROMI_021747 [Orobanche minor]